MAKRTGKHTSTDKSLKGPVNRLLAQKGVDRVVLGPYHNCRHRFPVGSLRFQADTDTGIKVKGYCGDGIRDLFVYLVDPVGLRESIKCYLKEEYGL
jgi:hypothetical protein